MDKYIEKHLDGNHAAEEVKPESEAESPAGGQAQLAIKEAKL
jgi:hypothetical protein